MADNVTLKANEDGTSFSAVENYPVWLGDTQVTSANKDNILADGTASYDPTTKTLTLSGYNGSYIKANHELTINVASNSTITVPEATYVDGIYTKGECNLTGSGNLTIAAHDGYSRGVYVGDTRYNSKDGKLVVNMSGNLTVNNSTSGLYTDASVVICGSGNVDITAGSFGVHTMYGDITISGSGDVTATATRGGAFTPLFGKLILSGSGNVTATSANSYAVEGRVDGAAVVLDGTNPSITFKTEATDKQAVYNNVTSGTLVSGTNFGNYDVTGAPDSSSVMYTLKHAHIIAIFEGDGQEWTKGTTVDLTFRSNAEFADFLEVMVDGVVVHPSDYTAEAGSTIITLKASFLEKLSVGKHTIVIVSKSGKPSAEFTVKAGGGAVPKTGDNGNFVMWSALLAAGVCGVASTPIISKRKKAK